MIHNKILKICSRVKDAIRNNSGLQTGFSMLEAVVVVGVLLAIAVGGLFAYGPIVQNAKLAKLKSAASEVYTAATVYQVDGDPKTKPQDALDAWNASSTSIKVGFFDTKVVAVPAMMAAVGEYVPPEGADFCIQATDAGQPDLDAKSGDCPVPASDGASPTPTEPAVEVIPNRHMEMLKNGDFSAGLTYWDKIGNGAAPTVPAGQAVITPGSNKTSGVSQKVSIPDKGITHMRYFYQVESNPWSGAASTIRISAYDLAGKLIKDVDTHALTSGSPTPKTEVTVDLTEFAGQDIRIAFQVDANSYDRTAYFDDISIQNTHEAPSAPTAVTVTVTNSDAAITWTPPIYGDASVTSYKVTPSRNGKELTTLTTVGNPPKTSTIFKGLTNGGDYTFRVTAINSIGESAPSVPSENYSRPADTWDNGDFSAGLTAWAAIGVGPAPVVTAGEGVINPGANKTGGLSQIVTIPDNGITYVQYAYRLSSSAWGGAAATFTVSAYDSAGVFIKEIKKHTALNGLIPKTIVTADLTEFAGRDIKLAFQLTNNSYGSDRPLYLDDTLIQTTTSAPSAPSDVKIAVNDTDATVSWTAPSSGAASVTEYAITPYRDGNPLPVIKSNGEPPATSAVFKGFVSNSTYTFKVTAMNKLGTSDQSAASAPYFRPVKSWTNGDFASGLTGWSAIGTGKATVVTSGEAVINPGQNVTGGLSQTVSIPSQGTTKVNYSYRIGAIFSSNAAATFNVSAYNPDGSLIKVVKAHSISNGAIAKTAFMADLTEFAGKDIKLTFQLTNNAYGNDRALYLDDTSVITN